MSMLLITRGYSFFNGTSIEDHPPVHDTHRSQRTQLGEIGGGGDDGVGAKLQ